MPSKARGEDPMGLLQTLGDDSGSVVSLVNDSQAMTPTSTIKAKPLRTRSREVVIGEALASAG